MDITGPLLYGQQQNSGDSQISQRLELGVCFPLSASLSCFSLQTEFPFVAFSGGLSAPPPPPVTLYPICVWLATSLSLALL